MARLESSILVCASVTVDIWTDGVYRVWITCNVPPPPSMIMDAGFSSKFSLALMFSCNSSDNCHDRTAAGCICRFYL